jgi:hypothetical protein
MPPVQLGGDQRRDVDVVDPQVPDLPVDVGVDQVDAAHHDPAQVGAVQPGVGQVDVAQPGAVEPDPVEPGRAEVDALEERPVEVGVDEVSHARDASAPHQKSSHRVPAPSRRPAALSSRPIQPRYRPLLRLAGRRLDHREAARNL